MDTARGWSGPGTRVQVVRAGTPRGAVVLVPDVGGVDDTLRDAAERLAGLGWDVAVPDLWWRTGGPPPPADDDDGEAAEALVADYDALADIAAARDALPPERPRFLVGFGLGGLYARMAACVVFGFSGAVEFYGRIVYPTITPRKPAQPLDLLPGLSCPLQCHFGEDDPVAPLAHVAQLEERLAGLSQPTMVFTYPGCAHGFLDPRRPGWDQEAARTAWARAVSFLDHLAARAR